MAFEFEICCRTRKEKFWRVRMPPCWEMICSSEIRLGVFRATSIVLAPILSRIALRFYWSGDGVRCARPGIIFFSSGMEQEVKFGILISGAAGPALGVEP